MSELQGLATSAALDESTEEQETLAPSCFEPWPGVEYVSPWGPHGDADALARHAAFGALIRDTVTRGLPWLARLIELSGARVLALEGTFYLSMPAAPGEWVEIPEVGAALQLVPWREDWQAIN